MKKIIIVYFILLIFCCIYGYDDAALNSLDSYEPIDPYSISDHNGLIELYDELRNKYAISVGKTFYYYEYSKELENENEQLLEELQKYKNTEIEKEEHKKNSIKSLAYYVVIGFSIYCFYSVTAIIKNKLKKSTTNK